MLNNRILTTKTISFVKNNFYLTNYVVSKTVNYFLVNLNYMSMYVFEKYLLEYWIKNFYTFLANYTTTLIFLYLQIFIVVLLL